MCFWLYDQENLDKMAKIPYAREEHGAQKDLLRIVSILHNKRVFMNGFIMVLCVLFGFFVASCGEGADHAPAPQTTEEVGNIDDVGSDAPPGADANNEDAGNDTVSMDADASIDTEVDVSGDVQADVPDVSMESDVVDQDSDVLDDTVDADTEGNVFEDVSLDGVDDTSPDEPDTTDDTSQTPSGTLTIESVGDQSPQIFYGMGARDLVLAEFRVCAVGGDVGLERLVLRSFGWFQQVRLLLSFAGQNVPVVSSTLDTISMVFEMPVVLLEGECQTLSVLYTYSMASTFEVSYFQAMEGWGNGQVFRYGGWDAVYSRVTAHNPTPGATVSCPWPRPCDQLVVDPRTHDALATHFALSTGSAQLITVRRVTGVLNSSGNFNFPLFISVVHTNPYRTTPSSEILNLEATVSSGGDWEINLPDISLGFGDQLSFVFFLESVPEGAVSMQLHLTEIEIAEEELRLWVYDWDAAQGHSFQGDVPGPLVVFEEPVLPQTIHCDWFGQGRLDVESNFVSTFSELSLTYGYPRLAQMFCTPSESMPLAELQLSSLRLLVTMDGLEPLSAQLLVVNHSARNDEMRVVGFEMEPGESSVSLDEPLVIPMGFDRRIDVYVLLEGIPVATTETLFFQVTIEEMVVEGLGMDGQEEIPVRVARPNDQRTNWGDFPFPLVVPPLFIHLPEVWLVANYSGGPARVISLADTGPNVDTELFKLDAEIPYGDVVLTEVRFRHNSGKDHPPFRYVRLRIQSSVYVLVDWNQEEAVFSLEDGGRYLPTDTVFTMTVDASEPTEVTERLRFDLVSFEAISVDEYMWDVPFIVADDFGLSVSLNEGDSSTYVRGRSFRIVP